MLFRNYKAIIAIAFITMIAFISCQREVSHEGETRPTLSSKDPAALAASIRVWHGVRTQGTLPAARGAGIQLDASANEPVLAFAGRYAIIQPEVITGDVKGYYVTVNGSSQYFNVDYSKPRDLGGRVRPGQKRSSPFMGQRVDSSGNGNIDSSIVIVLPQNIQVPDTFCVTYCAYDSNGNISQPVTTCIFVSSLGADANGSWIGGNWRFTASWDATYRDTIIYNRWTSWDNDYYCEYDSASGFSYVSNLPNGSVPLGGDSVYYRKADLNLSSNGAQRYDEDYEVKYVDQGTSTCQQLVYATAPENYFMTGGWSYNSATNKITIIFEFDDFGIPTVEAWEYDVIRVSNNNFIMVDNWDPSNPYYIRLQK
jgi:hypothetical protein